MTEIRTGVRFDLDELAENPLIAQVNILGEREGGVIDAMVPAELISREEVPVNEAHVAELKASIENEAARGEGTGQLSPVLLAEIPGEDRFPIIDGFHRDAALSQLGRPEIFAIIRRDSTPEEVLDLRILTATMHSSVTFARIVEWINDAWQRSPWAEKISVTQVFALVRTANKIPKSMDQEEASSIREWAQDKCQKWGIAASTVHTNLITAEIADPVLVKEARARAGGHSLPTLTPQHLGLIARAFPHDYARQRAVATLATEHNMTVNLVRATIQLLGNAETAEEIEEIAAATDWKKVRLVHSSVPTNLPPIAIPQALAPRRRKGTLSSAEAVKLKSFNTLSRSLTLTELELGRAVLETHVLKGLYLPPLADASQQYSVDYEAESDVAELVQPLAIEANVERFLSVADSSTDRLKKSLTTRYQQNEETADQILRQVSYGILTDMREGDLRFVDIEKELTINELLIGCLRRELALRAEQTARPAPHPSAEPLTAPLADLLEAVPGMQQDTRRAFIAHALLGISPQTIGSLVKDRHFSVNDLLADGYSAVMKAQQYRQLQGT